MSKKFTGGDHLTHADGLKYCIHQMMMVNELRGGKGAYEISNAVAASSGPSFGPIQYDLGANSRGRELFGQIAQSAVNSEGARLISDKELAVIEQHLYKPFSAMSRDEKALYSQLKPKIDKALGSAQGMTLINQDYSGVLDEKVGYVNQVIAGVTDKQNKQFLQTSLESQLIIADIKNQYGTKVNQALAKFLNRDAEDAPITLPGRHHHTVKVAEDVISIADLQNFRYATEYGVHNHADAQRRNDNIHHIVEKQQQQQRDLHQGDHAKSIPDPIETLWATYWQHGHSTTGLSAIKNLSDKIQHACPRLDAEQNTNATAYLAAKAQQGKLPVEAISRVEYEQPSPGKELLHAVSDVLGKFVSADVAKAIATPAEQTLTNMQQQPEPTQQHRHAMVV